MRLGDRGSPGSSAARRTAGAGSCLRQIGVAGAGEAAGVSLGDGAEPLLVPVWPAALRRWRAEEEEEEERGGVRRGVGAARREPRGGRHGKLELAGEVRRGKAELVAELVAGHGAAAAAEGLKPLQRGLVRMVGGVGVRYF